MAAPIRFKLANNHPLKYSTGDNFNGFIVFTLQLPSGYSKKARLSNAIETDIFAPEVFQIWVRDGFYESNAGFWSNSSISPIATTYKWEWYDASGSHITQLDNNGTPQNVSLSNEWSFTGTSDFVIDESSYDIIGSLLMPTGAPHSTLSLIAPGSFV